MNCNFDCFHCPYKDCMYDGITESDRKLSSLIDEDIESMKPGAKDRERKMRHYQENKEQYLLRMREYYKSNKEEILQKQREYKHQNRKYFNEYQKEYKRKKRAENPELYRQKQREYKDRKKAERKEVVACS